MDSVTRRAGRASLLFYCIKQIKITLDQYSCHYTWLYDSITSSVPMNTIRATDKCSYTYDKCNVNDENKKLSI